METDITVTLTEREVILIRLALASAAVGDRIVRSEVYALCDKLVPDISHDPNATVTGRQPNGD
jgi:hypothetical protein